MPFQLLKVDGLTLQEMAEIGKKGKTKTWNSVLALSHNWDLKINSLQ